MPITTYLIRANLDISVGEGVERDPRYRAAIETILKFSSSRNKVVILTHRGRPEGRDLKFSLQPLRAKISASIGKEVCFLPTPDLGLAKKLIADARPGSVFLFENLRFFPEEIKGNVPFARKLASLGTKYIGDDFATCHRAHASIALIPRFIPGELGPTVKREINVLQRVSTKPDKPFVLVIGGAKMSDKAGVIEHLLPITDYVLLGGGAANTFMKAAGVKIGSSICEPALVAKAKRLMAKHNSIILPVDEKKEDDRIYDIGPATIKHYAEIIRSARTIVWAGPMGLFEKEGFAEGSRAVARAIAASTAYTVAGGGETGRVITDMKLEDKFSFVSTGGSAMLEFLAGKKLPGIEAIKIRRT